MPEALRKRMGFREVRSDLRARRKFLIATWLIGILLVGLTGFAVYLAVGFVNRIFAPAGTGASSVTRFNIPDAMKIRRLEHLWTTPSP
jgi:hypothetical protein